MSEACAKEIIKQHVEKIVRPVMLLWELSGFTKTAFIFLKVEFLISDFGLSD